MPQVAVWWCEAQTVGWIVPGDATQACMPDAISMSLPSLSPPACLRRPRACTCGLWRTRASCGSGRASHPTCTTSRAPRTSSTRCGRPGMLACGVLSGPPWLCAVGRTAWNSCPAHVDRLFSCHDQVLALPAATPCRRTTALWCTATETPSRPTSARWEARVAALLPCIWASCLSVSCDGHCCARSSLLTQQGSMCERQPCP